jgi:ETC complex I subunit conserved region
MTARIYKPAKTAMQSGRAKTQDWTLNFDPADAQQADPLMGWAGSRDTRRQLSLRFATQEEAEAYCKKHGIEYAVGTPQAPAVRPKSYADNFRPDRVR